MNTFRIFKLSGKIKLAGLKLLPNGPLRVGETSEAIRAFFFTQLFSIAFFILILDRNLTFRTMTLFQSPDPPSLLCKIIYKKIVLQLFRNLNVNIFFVTDMF